MAAARHEGPPLKLTWVFQLIGGEAVAIQVGNFPVPRDHDGGLSLWTLVLTEVEAADVESLLTARGVRVTRWAEIATPEQETERQALMRAQAGDVDFPTAQCTTCFWLDLQVEGLCGLREWDTATRQEAARTHAKARIDALDCPLHEQGE